ncbi:MAG: Glycosyltransferase [Phormidesmis priestleyi Ana]|uniref:Glycosyltransferase n=1 Tax=Phormidesmis priestleyi Ana TaxID=1666911 RepID=A0A0N8KNG8_9CYAN|nr:MAG: Glycosyltransferase [Phormidesmis priestleyi Ana]
MKILLVNDYGGATGGAEIQMLTLRQQLRDRGHDARLFASNAEVVTNSPILADYICYGTTESRTQVISQTFNLSAYQTLKRALREFQPDVVHVRMFMWQLSPLILPLLRSYPSLYQTAVYKAICPMGTNILPDGTACRFDPGASCLKSGCFTPQSWIFMMVQRALWNRWKGTFDRVVALSTGMKQTLEAAGMESVSVIYNGVPERPPRPPLSDPPTVGYAGRFSAEKGVETLFRAFAKVSKQVPNAQLKVAGRGVEAVALKVLAQQLGFEDRVVWLGHLSRAELEQQFDSVWVQVVPSLWAEPFGNVTTEAMMRGTAVVASAVGAQPEIVGSAAGSVAGSGQTAGMLVPPGNVDALTAALLPILQQRSVAEQMGAAGRRRALAEFSETRCLESFLGLYNSLVGDAAIAAHAPLYSPS